MFQSEMPLYTFYADEIARFNVNDTDYRIIVNPGTMNIMVPTNKNSILYFVNQGNNFKTIPTLRIEQTPDVETINIPLVTNIKSSQEKKSYIDYFENILLNADFRKLLVIFCSDNFSQQFPDPRLNINRSNNLISLNDNYSKDLLPVDEMNIMTIFKKTDSNQKKTVILSRTPTLNYQNDMVLNYQNDMISDSISNFFKTASSLFLLCVVLCIALIILCSLSSIKLVTKPTIKEIPTASD